MYAVTVHLQIKSGVVTPAESAEIGRRIQAAALPRERLEHLYIQHSSQEVFIVLFFVAPDLDTAEQTAADLVERARIGGSGGYLVADCAVRLNAPLADAALRRDP